MARLNARVGEITDKNGNAINPTNRSSGEGGSYNLIEPGYYTGVVRAVVHGEYRGKSGKFKNKAASDGKWTYWKLTPDIKLMNAEGTVLNRQDIPVGVVQDGALMRPDGDKSKSALWPMALYFLGALGLLAQDDGGEFSLDFDPDLISDRILKVKTDVGGYIKGERSFEPDEIRAMLTETNGGVEYEFDDIPALVAQWNDDNGYDNEDEVRLKVKNVAVGFYAVDTRTITDNGFYLDETTQGVFTTELDFENYLQRLDRASTGTPNDVSDIPF